ncbi:hypothetical protein PILCRDRAFT_16576, partial [Piloderma croceum F 1598]
SLFNHSLCLSNLGHREHALEVIQEAVNLQRKLAADLPDVFNPDLARSLHDHSVYLSDLDHREHALEVIQEAVNLQQKLAADRPDVFNPDLAWSLHGLSFCLSNLGHRERALEVIQEAVNLRQKLAADRPDVFNPDLAGSLHNLSLRLSDLGHRERALEVIQEAVNLHRKLTADLPDVFNPNLARSLRDLSVYLSNLGHPERALEVIQEAVNLQRKLATDRPDVFNPDLAGSLHDLSASLSDLGHQERALEVIQEAVNLRRKLATDRPGVFNHNLARSLNNFSVCLSDLGHHERALEVIQEAVNLQRKLAADRPDVFNHNLARSLNDLSVSLSDLGHRERALEVIQEAVNLRRKLAADRPGVFNPHLAASLHNLSLRLSDLGYRGHALEVIQDAVDLRRKLATDRPGVFNSVFASSLDELSRQLANLGYTEQLKPALLLWTVMFSFFTCPAISAVRETDSSISSSHCLPSHSKLVLRPPELIDDMICSVMGEDTLSAPSPCAGVGTLSDDLDFSKPLKRSTSRRPPRIITLLKGVPAPPVLTPTNSPLVSPNNAELVPGSDLLHFDDDGALFYCMPEPNSEPASMSESYSTRCLAFAPLTPIMECSEPYDLGEATAFPSQCGLSGIQTSLSTASFQPSIVESVSHFDLIVPLPPSSEQISYFAHLDSVNSGLDDIDLSLPNQYPEVVSETIEIQAPSPSRRHIDSVAFHRLIHSTWNDVDGGNSGVDVEGPPALEHCLTSGESTPYGPITPIALSLNDAGLMITSDSDSYFGSGFKSKKPSPFSSLLYVGRPTTPFELPSVSVFDPFGLDDDTLPPCHFESVHVGVDIVNELLADEEEEPEAGHVISPFDQLKHDILCDTLTTTEQGNPATEAFVVDHTASSDFADSISGKIISSVDMLALSK